MQQGRERKKKKKTSHALLPHEVPRLATLNCLRLVVADALLGKELRQRDSQTARQRPETPTEITWQATDFLHNRANRYHSTFSSSLFHWVAFSGNDPISLKILPRNEGKTLKTYLWFTHPVIQVVQDNQIGLLLHFSSLYPDQPFQIQSST